MAMLTTAILLALLCIVIKSILPWLLNTLKIWGALRKVDGPKGHWFLGNIDENEPLDAFLARYVKVCEQYPNFFPFWYTIANPVLVISNPVTAREFIKSSNTKEILAHKYLREWTGPGVLYGNGKLWARSRRLLTPAFHFNILKSYISVYNDCTQVLIDKWAAKAKEGKSFEILEDMSLCTFDIILQCACSVKVHPQTHGSRHRFLIASRENTALCESRLHSMLHMVKFFYQLSEDGKKFYSNVAYSRKFAVDVIKQRKAAIENQSDIQQGRKYLDFLDTMLAAKDSDGVGMTVDEIANEVIAFLFAGHDTTSSSLSWLLFSFACNPEWQIKCREEVEQHLASVGRTDLEWGDLTCLPNLTMCIKESQRLHTTVPFLGYTLGEDITVNGVTFPKGMDIEVPPYIYHHDSRWWKDPWKFDPTRFASDNKSNQERDPYVFMPFAVGTRNCIGQNFALQELKTVAAKLLQRFEFTTNDPTYRHTLATILKDENGIWLTVKDRQ